MAESRDWDELVWAWRGWRDESGAKMPDDYERFIELQNQAATMNGIYKTIMCNFKLTIDVIDQQAEIIIKLN